MTGAGSTAVLGLMGSIVVSEFTNTGVGSEMVLGSTDEEPGAVVGAGDSVSLA